MSKSYFSLDRFLTLILGAFFIVSAYGKMFDAVGFADLINAYGLGFLSFLAPFLIALEALVGLALIFELRIKESALLSAGLLIIFTLAFVYGYFVNGIEDCGCFGAIDELKTNPLLSFLRNGLLILLALLIWKRGQEHSDTKIKYGLTGGLTIVVGVISFYSYFAKPDISNAPNFNDSKLTQESGLNHPILRNYINTHIDSTYMVLLIGYGCSHCWNNVPNVPGYLEQNIVDRIVVLGYEPEGTDYKRQFYNNFDWPYKTIDVDVSIARAVVAQSLPTTYLIKNNQIEIVLDGIIHPADMFRSYYPDF